MPYVITTLCTNDGACVEVCPVACIHTMPGASQFYIDPEVCIDVSPVEPETEQEKTPSKPAGS